ncbi:MAG: RNA polymerase sigma factor [Acidimicrobiales bacterium]
MASITNLDRGLMDHNSAPNDSASRDEAEASFRRLFTSTYMPLLAYARRRSFDHAEADDVVAEVYATAWRRRDDLRPDTAPLPWLYGIAANVLRNNRRAGSRRLRLVQRLESEPQSPTSVPTDGDPGGPDADGSGAHLREALSRLSFDDQEVLRLVAWEGLSHAETGQALGCSTNAVGIRIHRARQRLQAELTDSTENTGPTDTTQRRGGAPS